jgi:hypothetical protein
MTATIDRTKEVRLPNGKSKRVNVFDYNLAFWCDGYVQLTDTSWLKARTLWIYNLLTYPASGKSLSSIP